MDCQAVGSGKAAVKYLAPYVFRVAISDARMVQSNDQHVTFRYRPSGSRRARLMTVTGQEFVRRLLTHVLPRGFQKVRHLGLLSPNCLTRLESLRWLIAATAGLLYRLACRETTTLDTRALPLCRDCGQLMVLVGFQPRSRPKPTARPP